MPPSALPPRRPFAVRWLLRIVALTVVGAVLWAIDGSMVKAIAVLVWAVVTWTTFRTWVQFRSDSPAVPVRRPAGGRFMRFVLGVGLGSQMLLLVAYAAAALSRALHQ